MQLQTCPLDRDWAFRYDAATEPTRHGDDEPGWATVSLPHTWHTWETTGQVHPFTRDPSEIDDPYWWHGWGSYRKRLTVTALPTGSRVFLVCEAIQTIARILVNDQEVAVHRGGYASFSVEIGRALRPGANEILIQVHAGRDHPDAIPPMTAGNWNIYGGIYRSIQLVHSGPLRIAYAGNASHPGGVRVDQELDGERAELGCTTWIDAAQAASCIVRHRLCDAEGTTCWEDEQETAAAAGIHSTTARCTLTSHRRWSPADPYLYTLQTSLLVDGAMVDQLQTRVGLRSIDWDYHQRRLILNGEPIRLIGGNRHQEWPWLGDALPGPQWHEWDLDVLRDSLGHNFMRFCHYTQDRCVYDWCDEHGVLVFEEVPNIKALPFSPTLQQQQVREMIRRDQHHACIVGWSMGNETTNPADGATALAEDASRLIHYRHVSWRDRQPPEPLHDHRQLELENVLRCSVRGWFDDEVADRQPADGQRTGTEHHQFDLAVHGYPDGRPALGSDDNLVTWVFADHGADREYGDSPLLHVNPKGWVDCYRIPKYIAARWQAAFTRPLMVAAQPDAWRPHHLGSRRTIVVSSNADRVELHCGGSLLASGTPSAAQHWCCRFPGIAVLDDTLVVRGIRGDETVEQQLPMSGPAARLRLHCSHGELPADRVACALLTVSAEDANGNSLQGQRPELQFQVDGPARLLAPDHWTSDHRADGAREGFWYIDLPIRVPLRMTATPGPITVTVNGAGLAPASCQLRSQAVDLPALPHLRPEPEPDRPRPTPPDRPCRNGTLALAIVHDDRSLPGPDYRTQVAAWFADADPAITDSPPYQRCLDRLVQLFEEGDGQAIADDINTAIMACNRALLGRQ